MSHGHQSTTTPSPGRLHARSRHSHEQAPTYPPSPSHMILSNTPVYLYQPTAYTSYPPASYSYTPYTVLLPTSALRSSAMTPPASIPDWDHQERTTPLSAPILHGDAHDINLLKCEKCLISGRYCNGAHPCSTCGLLRFKCTYNLGDSHYPVDPQLSQGDTHTPRTSTLERHQGTSALPMSSGLLPPYPVIQVAFPPTPPPHPATLPATTSSSATLHERPSIGHDMAARYTPDRPIKAESPSPEAVRLSCNKCGKKLDVTSVKIHKKNRLCRTCKPSSKPQPDKSKWPSGGPCDNCKTTRSPAWRRSHDGLNRSLCNLCGLRQNFPGKGGRKGKKASKKERTQESKKKAAEPIEEGLGTHMEIEGGAV